MAALEADRERFNKAGAEILAINPASVKSHDNYCDKKGFNFTILSDPDKKVLGHYKALKAMGKLADTGELVGFEHRQDAACAE